MRNKLNEMLKKLNTELISMSGMCEDALLKAISAFENKDLDLANQIIEGDTIIDKQKRIIEDLCLAIILHQQPIAYDLTQVSVALKMITDLERIGDHACDIAAIIKNLNFNQFSQEEQLIKNMATEAVKMLKQVIEAFINHDTNLAEKVFAIEEEIDQKFQEIKASLISHIKNNANSDDALDLFMISKYLERIGDHTCNIADSTIKALDK